MDRNMIIAVIVLALAWYVMYGQLRNSRYHRAQRKCPRLMALERRRRLEEHGVVSGDDPIYDAMDMARAGASMDDINNSKVNFVV